MLDQLDDAIAALRKAIQLDPQRTEAYYNLALVYRRKGQVDLAIQAYREALRVNPRMADAHYNLANLFLEKSQFKSAIANYRHALELRPGWEKPADGLAQAEAALADAEPSANPSATTSQGNSSPTAPASAHLDPDRLVDPNVHGVLLTGLHKATIDSENYTRHFQKVIETEIEPAIKELSSALLYPDTPQSELDDSIQKFEAAIQTMRSARRSLESSVEKVRSLGDRMLET